MQLNGLKSRNSGPRSTKATQRDASSSSATELPTFASIAEQPQSETIATPPVTTVGQAATISYSADMIEDYNNAMLPPCSDEVNTFCAVTNSQGQTELVTVSDNNQLLWMYPDPTASTGWSNMTTDFTGLSGPPSWMIAFYNNTGTNGTPILNVFYGDGDFNGSPAYGMQYDGTSWSAVILSSWASGFLSQFQLQPLQAVEVIDDNGDLQMLVCGTCSDDSTATVYFLGPDTNPNEWCVYYSDDTFTSLGGAVLSVQAGVFPNSDPSFVFMVGGSNGSQWYTATFDWANSSLTPTQQPATGSIPLRTTLWSNAVACSPSWYSLIVADNTTGLANWFWGPDNDLGVTPLVGGSNQPSAIGAFGSGVGPDGMLIGFAIEWQTNLLWMLQQTDQTDSGDFAWTPLGNYVDAVAVPPTMSVPQVIVFDDEGNLDLLSQNANGSWFKRTMASPTQPSQQYPACSGTPQTFSTVVNPATGNTELLTVNGQNLLVWLTPNSDAPNGWNQTTASFIWTMQGVPSWLCGCYSPNADGGPPILTVFFGQVGGAAFGMQYNNFSWSEIALSTYASGLMSAEQKQPLQAITVQNGNDSTALVYGLGPEYAFVIGVIPGSNSWDTYFNTPITPVYFPTPSNAAFLVVPSADYSGLLMCISAPDQFGSFTSQIWSTASIDFSNQTLTTTLAGMRDTSDDYGGSLQTYMLPGDANSCSVLSIDSANQLNNFSTLGVTDLCYSNGAPEAVNNLAVGQGTDGLFWAFALNPNSNDISFLQMSAEGTFSWTSVGNLGSPIIAIASISTSCDNPQFFTFSKDGNIRLVTFHGYPGPSPQSWSQVVVAVPYTAKAPLSSATTYTIELTAVDGNGNPVSGAVLTLSPDTPQTLVINNLALPASPGSYIAAVADGFGRVTVSSLATSLASTELTVNIVNNSNQEGPPIYTGTFRADYQVHNRLAGNDPQFPTDMATYQQNGVLPTSIDPESGQNFCTQMNQLAQNAVDMANPAAAPAARKAPRPYMFDFSTRGALICRDLTDAEIEAHRSRGPKSDSLGSWLEGLWGDVAHAAKQEWQKVKTIVVDDLEITITDIENDFNTFTMEVIDDIRDAVEMILQALNKIVNEVVDFIKKAVEWLKALFDWSDIVNTKNVLKYIFQQNVANLQTLVGNSALQTAVDNEFVTLGKDVNALFTQIESIFGEKTFTQAGPQSSNDPMLGNTNPMLATPLNNQWSTSSMQINYATTKANGNLPMSGAQDAVFSMSSIIDAFNTAFSDQEQNIQDAAAGLYQQMQNINSLSELLNTGVCTVLTAANEITLIIMAAVQGVIDAILKLASSVLTAMLSFLDQAIDIPVISALYQQISGDPLTILDLMCLIAAIPCTLLYKIFYGGADATAPFTAAQVQQYCSTPITWSWISEIGDSGLIAQDKEVQAPTDSPLTKILGMVAILCGFVNWVTDAAGDVLNLNPDGEQPPAVANVIGWINVVASGLQMFISIPYTGHVGTLKKADIWNLTNSLSPLLAWLCDIGSLLGSAAQAKFISLVGPGVVGGLGVVQLATGIGAAVEMNDDPSYNIGDQLNAVMSCLSPLCKWLTYVGRYSATAGTVCGVVMAGCDTVDDLIVPIVSFAEAI